MLYESSYYKVVLVGDTGCGKTSLIYKHKYDVFDNSATSTIGGEFSTLSVTTPDGSEIKMHLWDTAGQEKYRSLVRMYYRGAFAIVFVFDVTRIETLRSVPLWYSECDINSYDIGRVQMFLVGNKSDLLPGEDESPAVLQLVKKYVNEYNFRYIKTSAKDGPGIDILFDDIKRRIGLHHDFDAESKKAKAEMHSLIMLEPSPPSLVSRVLTRPSCCGGT